MLVMLVLTYLMCIFDYIMTYHWIKKFGIEIEMNPFGRFLFALGEGFGAFFVKVLLSLAMLVTLYIFRKSTFAEIGTVAIFIVYFALTIYHIYIIIQIRSLK